MGWKKSLYYTYIFTKQNILRLKYFFIHNISAPLCLLWTSLELHCTHLFQTLRIRCTLHFQQKPNPHSSSARLAGVQRLPHNLEGHGYISHRTPAFRLWSTHAQSPCPISNHHSTEIRGNDQVCLFKWKSTFQLWPDGAPKRLCLSKQLGGFFHTTGLI